MTSPEDFHLLSWKNAALLSVVVVAALVPVLLRKLSPSADAPDGQGVVVAGPAVADERTPIVKRATSADGEGLERV